MIEPRRRIDLLEAQRGDVRGSAERVERNRRCPGLTRGTGRHDHKHAARKRRGDHSEVLCAPFTHHRDRRLCGLWGASPSQRTDCGTQLLRRRVAEQLAQVARGLLRRGAISLEVALHDLRLLGCRPRLAADVALHPAVERRRGGAGAFPPPRTFGDRDLARRPGMLTVKRQRSRIDHRSQVQTRLDIQHLVLVQTPELRLQTPEREQCLAAHRQTAHGRDVTAARNSIDGREQPRPFQHRVRRRGRQRHTPICRKVNVVAGPAVPTPRTPDDEVGLGERRGGRESGERGPTEATRHRSRGNATCLPRALVTPRFRDALMPRFRVAVMLDVADPRRIARRPRLGHRGARRRWIRRRRGSAPNRRSPFGARRSRWPRR